MDNTGIVHPVQQTTAIGGRAAFLPETGWHLAAEGAYETGSFAHRQERAFGGYGSGGWTSAGRLHPGGEIGGLYLSGDDPSTKRWEGWDGFYSDWPKYSELCIYTMSDITTRVVPNDPGTWTNLSAVWIEGRLKTGAESRVRRAVHVDERPGEDGARDRKESRAPPRRAGECPVGARPARAAPGRISSIRATTTPGPPRRPGTGAGSSPRGSERGA